MFETSATNVIEATEEQVARLTALYKKGLVKRSIDISGLSEIEWLILRSIAGIGASEVGYALGLLSKWKTPLKMWKEKVSQIIEHDDNAVLRFGRNAEEMIVKEYEYLSGRTIQRVKDTMFIHPEIDCLFANLDGIILPAGGDGYGVLECKSTTSYVYESWESLLPSYYYRQAMEELNVINKHPYFENAEFEYVDFATMILDKREVKILRLTRDEKFIEKQTIELVDWYDNYVIQNVPPPESVAEWAVTEPFEDSYIVATDEIAQKVDEVLALKKEIDKMDKQKEALEEEIKAFMENNETLSYNGESIATWKMQKKTTVDSKKLKAQEPETFEKFSKESSYRVFRPKEVKVTSY